MTCLRPEMLAGISRLALVGVAKNCGKTTTLNHVLAGEGPTGRQVGLVSIGIDGESTDLLVGANKPPIRVVAGQWVVTAADVLDQSTARIEYVESLEFSTPLGEVVVGRVIEPGTMVLAGLRHRQDVSDAIHWLENHGVNLVLIDGAYGRTVAAKSELSDAVVVSTGAVLANDVATIVARTAELIDRLSLEPAESGWQRRLIERAITGDRCLLGGPDIEPAKLSTDSALLGLGDLSDRWTQKVCGVAVPGLVSDRVVDNLLAATDAAHRPSGGPAESPVLVVPDGTVLHMSADRRVRLRRHWRVRALNPARILAVSANPTGVQGHHVDSRALVAALARRWPNLTVFDPRHASR